MLLTKILLLFFFLLNVFSSFSDQGQHLISISYWFPEGFPGGSEVKASACNAGDLGSIPGSGRSPGEGNGNPLQYSCLENPMDGGTWWAIGFLFGFFIGANRDDSISISNDLIFFFLIFKLYIIVLVLPNIKMNLPQVYMCSPS